MAKLFDINSEIENLIDYETGEITDPEAFDKLQLERNTKLENIALLYKNSMSDAKQYEEQEKYFTAKKKACLKTADWARETLARELNGEKLEDKQKRFTTYYHPSTSAKTNMEILPDKWKKIDIKPMTQQIREALLAGEKIEGAWLEENQSLVIR